LLVHIAIGLNYGLKVGRLHSIARKSYAKTKNQNKAYLLKKAAVLLNSKADKTETIVNFLLFQSFAQPDQA